MGLGFELRVLLLQSHTSSPGRHNFIWLLYKQQYKEMIFLFFLILDNMIFSPPPITMHALHGMQT
jgi:hypothetical protein